MKGKYLILPAFLIFLISTAYGCDAEITGYWYQSPVKAGQSVPITVRVKYSAGFGETCNFLLDVGIVPKVTMLGTYPVEQQFSCCPGNENFGDIYWSLAGGMTGATVEKNFTVIVRAPDKGFCDHCAGMYGNTNPNCEQAPDLYFTGSGWYIVGMTISNGCYYKLKEEGKEPHIYYRAVNEIYVDASKTENQTLQIPTWKCGDGKCEYPESWLVCPQDCLTLNPMLILGIIVSIIIFMLLIYIWVIKK